MKYLKTINEALKTIDYKDMETWGSKEKPKKLDPPIDKNYFDMVFADFIEDGATSNLISANSYFIDNIKCNTKDLDDVIEVASELKSCINKIKDDYPDINYNTYDLKSLGLFYYNNYRYGEE